MRTIISFTLLFVMSGKILAQSADTAAFQAAGYFREAAAASNNQSVWPLPLYGPMILVDPKSRVAYANVPDSAGIFIKTGEGVYKGKLPQEIIIANTAITWQNRLWTLVLSPLPTDKDDRLDLMLHECFHRIQRQLNLRDNSPTVDHLATMNGRIYFLLELQALKAALNKPVDARNKDLVNALLFRRKRQELFKATFPTESMLEMNEGLAAYTGLILGRPLESIHQHLRKEIDSVAYRPSLIRATAYITGPVYGYLLYERFPAWTHHLDSSASFPDLVEKYYNVNMPEIVTDADLNKMATQYNGDAILLAEKEKEEKRLVQAAHYVHMFTEQRVLVINLDHMSLGFNPGTLFDLGPLGTVYPIAELKDVWGKLIVTNGGMLMKNWKVVTLSTPGHVSLEGNIINGDGWQLQLNSGWRIEQKDSLHAVLVKQP
ncbi:hypothetical protein SAMN05444266_10525 [Chitinophaga jiangningensis]|uniref:Uncharacterized protein n=1 Tax=Chitinophaga jiangningensis TaxID=1419482 RepID=A0A1M7DJX5_9BACT|nr:hypothetical protein [Chitinophaga jiangningensis]SHL79780.1 hypothetical protein SAMN05444266_10525 [Chitinophaga jiangningensis]